MIEYNYNSVRLLDYDRVNITGDIHWHNLLDDSYAVIVHHTIPAN
jgi:hypothetical protein